jgi:hypothetical protein
VYPSFDGGGNNASSEVKFPLSIASAMWHDTVKSMVKSKAVLVRLPSRDTFGYFPAEVSRFLLDSLSPSNFRILSGLFQRWPV